MILVVAWDGASFDVTQPLRDAGELPVLDGLMGEGAARPVWSTWPAVTFPAWSSFLTAADPDHHGLTDFTLRDGYAVRFVNATHRRLPSFLALASAAGARVGSYAVPVTYPPEAVRGLVVSGFDTPLGAAGADRRSHPPSAAVEIERRYGGLAVDGPQQSRIEAGWHERALARLCEQIELRTRIVCDQLREHHWDLFMVHYGESDTVAHQFWQFFDTGSPRYRADGPAHALRSVYRALDRALGRLLDAAGSDATVVVVSDHGVGGSSDRVIHWNRWLAERGWLSFDTGTAAPALMRRIRTAALATVPAAAQARLFRALPSLAGRLESGCRLGGIDWSHTRVFSEELNYFPALCLNLRGREPRGLVAEEDREGVIEQLTADLQGFRDPFDAQPVVLRVLRREAVYRGPYAGNLPDLFLELREPGGYSYASQSSKAGAESQALRRMRAEEMTGARGTSMAGAHRRRGLSVLRGRRIRPGRYASGRLADAGATVLALLGLCPSAGADGVAWDDLLADGGEPRTPAPAIEPLPIENYDRESEREVEDRLRALGYVD
jgi:predicted AlkP superfamily phosphohydrolase/phosphomutase